MSGKKQGFTAKLLTDMIEYRHPNFWGRKSHLILKPILKDNSTNWIWSPEEGNDPVGIDLSRVQSGARRITLLHPQRKSLQVFEHIGCLRYGGFSGVHVVGKGWPPYHGRALELLELCEKNAGADETVKLSHYTVSEVVKYVYPKCGPDGTKHPYTEILPAKKGDKSLTLNVHIDYRGLGEFSGTYVLPDYELFRKICSAHTQGWPARNLVIAKIARLFGWPHIDSIMWPQQKKGVSKEFILEQFALHRAQDILGALSLICGNGIFVGEINSYCSGHLGDVMALKEASRYITSIS